jgi:hypothetical protein
VLREGKVYQRQQPIKASGNSGFLADFALVVCSDPSQVSISSCKKNSQNDAVVTKSGCGTRGRQATWSSFTSTSTRLADSSGLSYRLASTRNCTPHGHQKPRTRLRRSQNDKLQECRQISNARETEAITKHEPSPAPPSSGDPPPRGQAAITAWLSRTASRDSSRPPPWKEIRRAREHADTATPDPPRTSRRGTCT